MPTNLVELCPVHSSSPSLADTAKETNDEEVVHSREHVCKS